jgi:hypothetical protein
MTDTERSPKAERGRHLRPAELILLAERRAERARRKAEAAAAEVTRPKSYSAVVPQPGLEPGTCGLPADQSRCLVRILN